MQTETIEIHPKLQSLIEFVPLIKQLFRFDVSIAISDHEKVIYYLPSQKVDGNINESQVINRKLEPNDPMSIILRKREKQVMNVPEELYGMPLRIVGTPIFADENNRELLGTITITMNVDTQNKLKKISEHFASSSEEISASTEELSKNATDFNTYIQNLSDAQEEMKNQVENTTKILEMINAVAKNTRILGFNAGIEAARSGEYGKGFSVVAKEITKLAEQSAESVNEIRNLLDRLKEKVDQVEKIVEATVDISKNQTTSIEEIAKSISNLIEVAEEIGDLAQEI